MYGLWTSVWGVMTDLQDGGELWTLRSDDDPEPVVFGDAEAAARFARILGRAEEREVRPVRLQGQALSDWLDVLGVAEAAVLLDPEFVAGEGAVGTPVPAAELRAAVSRAPIAV